MFLILIILLICYDLIKISRSKIYLIMKRLFES